MRSNDKLTRMCAHARASINLHLNDAEGALVRLKKAMDERDPNAVKMLHEISTAGFHLSSVADMAVQRVNAEHQAKSFTDFLSGLEEDLGIVVTPSDLKAH